MTTDIADHLSITTPSGQTREYHWVWLRDSCQCPACFNSHAKQKYFDTAIIPVDIRPATVTRDGDAIAITWDDGHQSTYSLSWLEERSALPSTQDSVITPKQGQRWVPWAGPHTVGEGTFGYTAVMDDNPTLGAALRHLLRYGFIVISGDSPDADAAPLCDRVAGFVDRSYFGEFFDLEVKPDDQTDSVAFSTRQLPLHTDIPYYINPPDYQFLHGLKVSADVTRAGSGRTRFVDGLAATRRLQDSDPTAFTTLTDTEVTYRAEYPWAEKVYESRTTIIQLDDAGNVVRLVNNPSKMFFNSVPFAEAPGLYDAYSKFKAFLQADECSYLHTWSQGDTVLFDNRRIFHGRGEFSPNITRTLRGGYFREVEILARARYLAALNP